jgi:hypothetical protein
MRTHNTLYYTTNRLAGRLKRISIYTVNSIARLSIDELAKNAPVAATSGGQSNLISYAMGLGTWRAAF